jgi:hypothetical protein
MKLSNLAATTIAMSLSIGSVALAADDYTFKFEYFGPTVYVQATF